MGENKNKIPGMGMSLHTYFQVPTRGPVINSWALHPIFSS